MGIRQDAVSLSRRLRERVRSAVRDSGDGREDRTDPEDDTGSAVESSGNLFQCSRCSAVYIAAEKHVCPHCETEVDQVRSTLACNDR
ncbi:hypothetical protein [Natrinema salsiterrestre]|uniref:Small CPxCG-related zinc finger protein n=1 Tax=Natrinema salsiterrestre TaxID=2950540 RepID=A0A9Q4KZ30_9EURY|nr:hypothetical protein [Natrinema salsiterrestre]MDF9744324.1 hypothetical protein [Natrinema salsiterrestre]